MINDSEVAQTLRKLAGDAFPEAKKDLLDTAYRIEHIGKESTELFTRGGKINIFPKDGFIIRNRHSVDFIKEFVTHHEKERGNLNPEFSDNIFQPFIGRRIPAIEYHFTLFIERYIKEINDYQILSEAGRLSIARENTYLEAAESTIQGILNGEVDQIGSSLSTYFKIEDSLEWHRFLAKREVNNKLFLSVCEAHDEHTFKVGDGACFSKRK